MIVNSYPEQYASAFKPVIFELRGMRLDKHLGATVDIMLEGESTPIGSKRFYNKAQFNINIAPYALSCINITPLKVAGLQQATKRVALMHIAASTGEVSEKRYIAAGVDTLPVGVLLSEWTQREIAAGEVDEFSFIPPAGEIWVEYEVKDAKGGKTHWRLEPFTATERVVTCGVKMDEIAQKALSLGGMESDKITAFKVTVYFGSSTAFEVRYKVQKEQQGARLAWVNRYGMVDCHTFPHITDKQIMVRRHSEANFGQEVRQSIDKAWMQMSLSSGLQPQRVVEWLAEVATSPQVWMWDNNTWAKCNITDSTIKILNANEPGEVALTIRPTTNINCQTL